MNFIAVCEHVNRFKARFLMLYPLKKLLGSDVSQILSS